MDFQTAVRTCLQKYVGFEGRARRSEYWWWVLFLIVVDIVAHILDGIVDPGMPGDMYHYGFIGGIVSLTLLLPGIAVSVRRLHDTDHSGLWYLLVFIPVIGWLVLLYWFVIKGTDGDNRFGPDPTKAG